MRVLPNCVASRRPRTNGPTSLRLPVMASIQNTKWTSTPMTASLCTDAGERL